MRTKLIAGNWKMNGTQESLAEISKIAAEVAQNQGPQNSGPDAVIFPPFTLIHQAHKLSSLMIGAQNCAAQPVGAYTGEISAAMIKDAGGAWVILGHSERRTLFHETNEIIRKKLEIALSQGLKVILCIGESEQEYLAGNTLEVLATQIDACLPSSVDVRRLAIAYEPIWAIGSGKTPTYQEITAVHGFIRKHLGKQIDAGAVRLLYGGSAKPSNAAEILACSDVDGLLIGGASLRATDFMAIYRAACV